MGCLIEDLALTPDSVLPSELGRVLGEALVILPMGRAPSLGFLLLGLSAFFIVIVDLLEASFNLRGINIHLRVNALVW